MDDLDHKTNAELNELFAEEVAGWTYRLFPDEGMFCTDANAVLPYLDPFMWVAHNTLDCGRFAKHLSVPAENGLHSVKIITGGVEYVGLAPTFARAAVLALIRAKRASKS